MASAELQTLIEMLRNGPLNESPSIEEMRQGMEAMTALSPAIDGTSFVAADADGVAVEWTAAPGVRDDRTILYLHGGGYVLGSIKTHRALVSRLSAASGGRALSVDYRLAPEHPFPAAVDDATGAYRWLLAQGADPASVIVAGDSAGGGLTLATLVALRDAGDPLPAAGVCLSPWVDLEGLGESMTSKAEADPMVQREGLLEMAAHYLGGADARTPLAAPLHADLAGLPALLIHVGTAETLLDDSTRFAEKARAAGVDVELEPWDDMIHVWHAFAPLLPEADQAIARIGEYVVKRTG
jgi:acetyl esterase/lipase